MKNKKMAKFSIEDNFFIIDSNNLDSIKTKLYGFSILEDSNNISNIDDKLNLNGSGCYVYLYVNNDKITIHQDYIGCYGIYLFQNKDYFALSNSFVYLIDYIKTKHKITLNKDYANYLLIGDLCSELYEDTMVNEIKMLARNAVIEIDKNNKSLKIDYIDYKEHTVDINNAKYFDILDNWYYRWIGIIRSLKKNTDNISMDLSGGMDSRCVLSLLLGSEIDLNTIEVDSFNDKLYCHEEDFEIASQISNDYGFTLNKNLNIEKYPFSLEDIINISFYIKLCFHKEMWFKNSRYSDTVYKFSGFGGGMIRDYRKFWNFENIFEFIKAKQRRTSLYPIETRIDISDSVEKIINKSSFLIKKVNFFKEFDDSNYLANFYRETRCRNHFGKATIEYYMSNMIVFSPLLDPELQKLKLYSKDCLDKDMLLAIMFTRFAPNLLNYKFEGKRFINTDTIEFTKKINNIKPFKKNNNFSKKEYSIIKSTDLYPQENQKKQQSIVKQNELSPDDFLLNVFHSDKFRYLFTLYYNQSMLDAIDIDIKKRKFYPLRHAYAIIGITKIINDVLISEKIDKYSSVFGEINNFINNGDRIYDFCSSYYSLNEQIQQKNEQIKIKNKQLKSQNELIVSRDKTIKNRDFVIQQKNNEIQNLYTQNKNLIVQNNIQDQAVKRLQNSWSYRIGRLFTYPLSIPLEFYKYIRDYNLIKKSDLFDSEYYLSQNEDVKNAKMDPIKHYLQFGWKEGRNPSAKFDGNEYLNKRPDVQVAGICPLVHYIKFGKDEK